MTIRYINIFTNLIEHKESEVVEFKKAENNFDFDDLADARIKLAKLYPTTL